MNQPESSKVDPAPSPNGLREEIDHTRAELGETMQELAARMDVPARMRAAYGRAAQRAGGTQVPWAVLAGSVVVVAVGVVLVVVRGRRR